MNFSDYTSQPSFQIAVERLGGTITGMTSVAREHARVELAGEVDRYAPARIEGGRNLLGKIVTPPFVPGSAAVKAATAEKLAALRKAQVERPGLNIDVPSTVDPLVDREAMEQRRWIELIGAAAVAESPAASAQVAVLRTNRESYRERLVELYRELFGHRPDIPRTSRPASHAPAVDEQEWAELAEARAEAVLDALLADGAVDPARVFLIRGEPVTATNGAVRMALGLK